MKNKPRQNKKVGRGMQYRVLDTVRCEKKGNFLRFSLTKDLTDLFLLKGTLPHRLLVAGEVVDGNVKTLILIRPSNAELEQAIAKTEELRAYTKEILAKQPRT